MGGCDKARLKLAGQSLIAHILRRITPQSLAVAVSVRQNLGDWNDFGLTILADPPDSEGPLAGLLAGMEWAAQRGLDWVLSLPTDCPLVPSDLVMRLGLSLAKGGRAALAASGGRHHFLTGLWSTALLPDLRHVVLVEKLRTVREWAGRCGALVCPWPDQPYDPFLNINRPDDLALAQKVIGQSLPWAGAVVLPDKDNGQPLLATLRSHLSQQGFRISGLLQEGDRSQDRSGICLRDLESGKSLGIMQPITVEGCCTVDPQAMADASMVLRRCLQDRPDLVLINKFGRLELDGQGLADEMMALLADEIPLLTTVSQNKLEHWLDFTGGMTCLLPGDATALRRWAGERLGSRR